MSELKPSYISSAVALALLGGTLVGVMQRNSAPREEDDALAGESGQRTTLASGEGVELKDEGMGRTAGSGDGFGKLPRAAHGRLAEGGEPPRSAVEIASHKQAALEEILGSIGSFPGLPEEHHERLAHYAAQLAGAEHPAVWCWAPGTPLEVVHAYQRVEQKIAQAAGLSVQALQIRDHWSSTAINGTSQNVQGQPIVLTWSFVPDGTTITPAGTAESTDPSSLRARLTQIYGGSATGDPQAQPWFAVFQTTFDNLAAISGLRFVYEPNDDGSPITSGSEPGVQGVRGDIRIGGHTLDGAGGALAYAYYPDNGDLVIDTGDPYFNDAGNGSLRMRNILEHELGHSLGLSHVCPINESKLMEPFITSIFRGSQFDDVYSHQRNYGDTLEVHGAVRDNDSAANATPLVLPFGSQAAWQWLSIDDDSDTDLFSISATTLQQITLRVMPSDPIQPGNPVVNSYPEGPRLTDGTCTGTAFDPTNQQDLVLDLLGSDGVTVMASAPARPAGETEEIAAFSFPTNGTYYIRVRGGAADRAQLYRLEALLDTAPHAPELTLASTRIDAESNSTGPGILAPGETVRLGITLNNIGGGAAATAQATLSGPAGTTFFTGTQSYGSLAAGGSAERLFTFAMAGAPGDIVNLQLTVTSGQYSVVLPFSLELGQHLLSTPLTQDFDASTALPAGWSGSVSGVGSPWVVSTNRFRSAPNSAFVPSVATTGEALLQSPAITIPAGMAVLEFFHRFQFQGTFDGGVLEGSLDGGAWFDLLNSDATVLQGDYNGTMASGTNSAIAGRQAWSGFSVLFVPVRIQLPASWEGKSIAFRWRAVHDNASASTGWNLDDVKLAVDLPVAEPFQPYVSLAASATSLIEGAPASQVAVTLSTPLPLVQELVVPLQVGGTASAADVVVPPVLVLPAGQTSASFTLSAVADGIAEGSESLLLTIPGGNADFTPKPPSSVSIIVSDPGATPATLTLLNLVAAHDGSPKPVSVVTSPAGLAVAVAYDGSTQAPTAAGTYSVVATVTTAGYSGSASGTLVIHSAYAAWITGFVNPADPQAAVDADSDGDGWDNGAEYTFGTSPANPTSLPQLLPVVEAVVVKLMLPAAPAGSSRFEETSMDLTSWTTNEVTAIPGGFQVPRDRARRFLRVVYQVEE